MCLPVDTLTLNLTLIGSYEDASTIFMIVDSNGDGSVGQAEFVEHWVLNH